MARVKLPDELKKEISVLTAKEKDRLIYRLLPKDPKLIDQLIYQLVEEETTLELRRDDLREYIDNIIAKYPDRYYSSLYLRVELRDISGRITYHKTITKDKLGEVEFNLQMLNGILEKNKTKLKSETNYMADKFNDYVIKRAAKIVKLIASLHEDYRLEFGEEMSQLADHIESISHLKKEAEYQDFDVETLRIF